MMWYRLRAFFTFYWRAITRYNVQSPFLYDFVSNILDTDKKYYAYEPIEKQRSRLKSINAIINIEDFGAGSQVIGGRSRKISEIAKHALSNVNKCRIIFQLVNYYGYKNIIELGTSLGISSAYLASADHNAKITTLEGDLNIITFASEVHQNLGLNNIKIVAGPFDKTLVSEVHLMKVIDMAFIDGHHTEKATVQYFLNIIEKCNNESIVVIDDIYWSKGMTKAWETIKAHSKVTLSIDLFDVGIVFFRQELSKQDVSYIPYIYKPWKIGLFA